MNKINDVLKYREDGLSYNEIAKKIGCSKSLVALYCNAKQQEKNEKKNEKKKAERLEYEKMICDLIKESKNINQVCKKIG